MDRRIPLDSVFSALYLQDMSESKQQDRREEMGASKGFVEVVRADALRDGDVFSTDGYRVAWVCLLSGGGPADEVSVTVERDGHEKTAYLAPDFPCALWREGSRS